MPEHRSETEPVPTVGPPAVTDPRKPSPFSSWLGVSLMALSFGTYVVYPFVPLLPISGWQQGGVWMALAAVSSAMFLLGSALVGKNALLVLKQRLLARCNRIAATRPLPRPSGCWRAFTSRWSGRYALERHGDGNGPRSTDGGS